MYVIWIFAFICELESQINMSQNFLNKLNYLVNHMFQLREREQAHTKTDERKLGKVYHG